MKIKVGCRMGLNGCKIEDTIEIPDGSGEKEIEGAAREWAYDNFDWWFEVK